MIGREIQLLDGSLSKVAVLWNQYMDTGVRHCYIEREVEGPDKIYLATSDFTWKDQLVSDDATYYLRVINLRDSAEKLTYQLNKPEIIREGEDRYLSFEGERIWVHLQNRYRFEFSRDFSNMPISTLINQILVLSGADAGFQVGTIYNSSEVVDFFSLHLGDSPLLALRQLNAKMNREMDIDESTSPITLDFPETMGEANGARLRYGTNLLGVTRQNDKGKRVTRMYGVGGGNPPLTVAASSLHTGENYIDSAQFDATHNNYAGKYENQELQDWENIIPAASSPDLSGTYTAGLCAGWAKIGTPTVTENLDTDHIEYGTKSQKVVATTGQGVSCAFTGVAGVDLVRWCNVKVTALDAAAVVRCELIDADGTTTYTDIEAVTNGFLAVSRQGAKYTNTSFTFKIYTVYGGATFYVDAALVAEGQAFVAFCIGSMADILYNETVNELAKYDADTAGVSYTVTALDLFEINPDTYPDYQIGLGDTVSVEDLELEIAASLRIKRQILNVIEPLENTVEVGSIKNTIDQVLAQDARAIHDSRIFTRDAQAGAQAAGQAQSDDRPITAQVARFSGDLSSSSYNSMAWGSGTLEVGVGTRYAINSGSLTGLTGSTPYWLYFDLDDPTAGFKITATYALSIGPRKAAVANVVTSTSSDAGLEIYRADGRPQLTGNALTVGTISANKCKVQAPGSSSAKVEFDANGIRTYNSGGTQTAEFGVTGAGWLGNSLTGISWDSDGNLTVGSSVTVGAPIDTSEISGTASGNSKVVIDEDGVSGYNSSGVKRFFINTDGTGWLGNSSTGVSWDNAGNLVVGSSVTIGSTGATTVESGANRATTGLNSSGRVTKQIDTSLQTEVLSDGASRVMIDGTGIRGLNAANVATFRFDATDGSGRLGALSLSPITWDATGALSVPGGIVTTGISATNITTGTLTIGPDANDKIELAWASGDFVLYRNGNAVVDLGDITGALTSIEYGLYVSDPRGAVYVMKDGAVGTVTANTVPTAFMGNVYRDDGEAATTQEAVFTAYLRAEDRTTGINGDMQGYRASVVNLDGKAYGFRTSTLGVTTPNGISGTDEAYGMDLDQIEATDTDGEAHGLRIRSVTGGAGSGGVGYGIRIDDDIGGNESWAIYSASGSYSYFQARVEFGAATPIKFSGGMGNSSKTVGTDAPADWVQIDIGGTTYYLPAYAA